MARRDSTNDELENPRRRFWRKQPATSTNLPAATPHKEEHTEEAQPFMPRLEESIVTNRRSVLFGLGGITATQFVQAGSAASSTRVLPLSYKEIHAKMIELGKQNQNLRELARSTLKPWRHIKRATGAMAQDSIRRSSATLLVQKTQLAEMSQALQLGPNPEIFAQSQNAIRTLYAELSPHKEMIASMAKQGIFNDAGSYGLNKSLIKDLFVKGTGRNANTFARLVSQGTVNIQSAQTAINSSQSYLSHLGAVNQRLLARRVAHHIREGQRNEDNFVIEESDIKDVVQSLMGAHAEFRKTTREIRALGRVANEISGKPFEEHPLARLQYYVLSLDIALAKLKLALSHIETFENALIPHYDAVEKQLNHLQEQQISLPVSAEYLTYIRMRLKMDKTHRTEDIERFRGIYTETVLSCQEDYKTMREKILERDPAAEDLIAKQEADIENFWKIAHEPRWHMEPIRENGPGSRIIGTSIRAAKEKGLSIDLEEAKRHLHRRLNGYLAPDDTTTASEYCAIVRPQEGSPLSKVMSVALQENFLRNIVQPSIK